MKRKVKIAQYGGQTPFTLKPTWLFYNSRCDDLWSPSDTDEMIVSWVYGETSYVIFLHVVCLVR